MVYEYLLKNEGKLIPANILGIDVDAPFRDSRMFIKVLLDNNQIHNIIDINDNITSLNNMYSCKKNTFLIKQDTFNIKDFVVFIDNNAEKIHDNTIGVGWSETMIEYYNNIGIVVEKIETTGAYMVLFNEQQTWHIIPSCLMKLNIKY